MKRVYFRPPGVSRSALLLTACISLLALVAVEALPIQQKQSFYEQKLAAGRLAREAMALVKSEKARRGIALDKATDPSASGLIGSSMSPVTSNTGYLDAKQVSVNPNFAAVIVDLLEGANLEKGDLVAVGLSGSFPALNISAFAAIQALELEPLVITSTASSAWGANDPGLMWPDMERLLFDKHVFRFRSLAASLGGIDDRGHGMSPEGREMLRLAIERNGLERIDSKSVADAIERRMQIYEKRAHDRPIRGYLNIGGGSASVGTHVGKKQFQPGVNTEPPQGEMLMDSVMLRFSARDVPVIHVTQIKDLAKSNGLSLKPDYLPRIGDGFVYVKSEYNRFIAAAGLVAIALALVLLIRLDLGVRLFGTARKPDAL